MRRATSIVASIAALAALGCGSSSTNEPAAKKATLVLDFLPNAVHAGIYRAQAAGYYRERGIDLRIVAPTSTSDTLKLLEAGKADFGIADGIDLAKQIDAGQDVQAMMAIVQRPLGGLITLRRSGITAPRQLEGKVVGVTGVPSDTAVLDTIVRDDGGDPAKVRRVTIGFGGIAALQNGKIEAFVGFYAADGVQVQQDGFPTRTFAFDDHGGPRYPGLVAFTTRGNVVRNAPLLRAFVAATIEGYTDTIEAPERSLRDLLAGAKGLTRPLAAAQLAAYSPLFQGDAPVFGRISERDVAALSTFLVSERLIGAPIVGRRYAADGLLP